MALILRPPTNRESLTESLHDLGRARRFVAIATAGLRQLAFVLGAALVFALLDASFHLSPLTRGVGLVGILTLAGVLFVRTLRPALRLRTDSLTIALDLEERFPRLNDALGSAVSFLEREDAPNPSAVSPRMQQAVVKRAHRLAERYNFREIIASGRLWRAFWISAIILFTVASLVLIFPQKAMIAVVRLADPFGSHPWPPRTQIRLVVPEVFPARTALGNRFDLRFELLGEIPPEAILHVQPSHGGSFTKAVPLSHEQAGDADSRDVAASLEGGQVAGSFQFRITANDGDTGWQSVVAAPPPKLIPRDGRASPQVHAEFPLYTRLPAIDLSDGLGVVDAPLGTTFTLRAASDLRLASGTLTYLGDRSAIERAAPAAFVGLTHPLAALGARILAAAIDRDFPVAIGPDRRTLDLTFRPSLSGLYGLRMEDESGIVGTRLLEFRLQPDPLPQVVLASPAPGRDPELLAPDVAVVFEVSAEDRIFALRRTFLEYRFHKDEPFREWRLHDGVAAQASEAALGGGWLLVSDPRVTRLDHRLTIRLADFHHPDGSPPRPGDTLHIRAAADDWDDVLAVKPPGRSAEIELRIAAREGIDAILQKELADLRKSLVQLRSQQREARTLTKDVKTEADGSIRPENRDKLLNAEQLQKQMEGKVGDRRDGMRARAERLRDTTRINNLPRGSTRERVESVAEGLGRLADRELGSIEPLLGEARQAGNAPRPGSAAIVADRLAKADRRQKAIEESLDGLLEQLEQWGSAGEIAGEARGLRDAIDQQAQRTAELGGRVPDGRSPDSLSPAERQELEKAAGRLDQLAEQAGGLIARAGRFAEERQAKANDAATTKDSAAQSKAEAEALRAGVQAAGGQALPDELRKAAQALRANRTGEAGASQQKAAERIGALGEALLPPPAANVEPPSIAARQAADRLDSLAEAQDELRKKVREAAANPDPVARQEELQRLAREQDRLRDDAKEMLQKLQRRKADDAARDLQAAIDQMEAARDDLEKGQPPAQPQEDAIDRLEQARDRLDREKGPEPAELSRENRRKLADQVRSLRDRQAEGVKELERIISEALRMKAWTRPLQASLDDLAGRERTLAEDVRTLNDKRFQSEPVIQRLLKESSEAMDRASQRIGDRIEDIIAADANAGFDAKVEAAAADRLRSPLSLALRRLDQLLEALKPGDPPAKPKATEPMDPGGDEPPPMARAGEDDGSVIPPLAELKILRSLQAELNERTAGFAKDHPPGANLTADDGDELKALEHAQREIASLFEAISGRH